MKNEEKSLKEAELTPQDSAKTQPTMDVFGVENAELSIVEMLKAGVHFGHKKSRWNPKMKSYTFGVKNDIHIIDLEKTIGLFQAALDYMINIVINGGKIMFVGTKPQAQKLIEAAARELEMPWVSNRWLGGTLTNFPELKKRIKYLNEQENKSVQGDFEKYTKYEKSRMRKEIARMNEKIGGIKKMENLPQALFVIDIKENNLAFKEALKAKVPIIGVTDTNTDPTMVDYPIPGNDDALSSIRYILEIIVKNLKEAKTQIKRNAENSVNQKVSVPNKK
jgi:small subunit ribosomal protein S2